MMVRMVIFLLLVSPWGIWLSHQNCSILKSNGTEQIQVDSLKLLRSLYKDVKIISSKSFSDFSYDIQYDERTKKVTVKSSKNIEGTAIEYFIVFQFHGNAFDPSTFSASDDEVCQYLTSYFKIDNDSVSLEKSIRNNEKEMVEPCLLWYGKDFGITGRYYKFEGKQYFLLRGLDLYCNGHHCRSYQLFAIVKSGTSKKVEVFETASVYPYDFENTFLFDKQRDGHPEIYLPKEDQVKSVTDFQLITLFP